MYFFGQDANNTKFLPNFRNFAKFGPITDLNILNEQKTVPAAMGGLKWFKKPFYRPLKAW